MCFSVHLLSKKQGRSQLLAEMLCACMFHVGKSHVDVSIVALLVVKPFEISVSPFTRSTWLLYFMFFVLIPSVFLYTLTLYSLTYYTNPLYTYPLFTYLLH